MFKPVDPKRSFPDSEEETIRFWESEEIFRKSIAQREGGNEFVFYDGPPFATGLPHFGHFVPGTIKDIVPRYKTMKGFMVDRRFGWDCHGLPVENLIEKELGLDSKTDIERYGVANFNEACRSSVLRYTKEWRTIMTRAGRWVDFDRDYKTMDPDYMESIWWVMKTLWDKGLIYEGHYILPYCPRCSTVLSNHELQLGGYKDVHDPAVTLRFRIRSTPAGFHDPGLADPASAAYFLAWTTTPWTLPSNLALALGEDIDYVCVADLEGKTGDRPERYVLAEARLADYWKDPAKVEVLWKKKGSELLGLGYEPLFPYFAGLESTGAFKTYRGEHVTTEDGTGIVHTAPGFGEEDQLVLKGTGVPTICPIDAECKFTEDVPDYKGIFVKDADKAIMERLKAEGKLVKRDQILHAYPHCWRCEHPLIYRAVSSWFVKIDPVKKSMIENNQKVYWMPEHIKNGRMGKWLEGARDWAISRSRYWGNPLPIWKCPDCEKTICVGSRDELEKLSGVRVADFHKHFVDDITIPCSCGSTMRRIPEVLDCWFESGAMPYAQVHYPFENKKHFEEHFPADFICEGLDQTRGWFYSLTVLAAALFGDRAFKSCAVNGLVLASDGRKMSKSLRNYTDPTEVMNQFGADALRFFLMNSAVTRADDLRYTDDGVKEVLKGVLLPIRNAYGFFVTYANIDGWPEKFGAEASALAYSAYTGKSAPANGAVQGIGAAGGVADSAKGGISSVQGIGAANPLDRWVLSVCEKMVRDIGEGLEALDMQGSLSPFVEFIDLLNNWYIRRSRRRFWRSAAENPAGDRDKAEAYATLYRVLLRLALVTAPTLPFISEEIWRNLRRPEWPESVHLAYWPDYDESLRDEALEREMAFARRAVSLGRALRVQKDIKTRQPLATVHLVTRDAEERRVLGGMGELLREELNVKNVVFRENEEELVEYSAKANFRVLGKELGKDMKSAADAIEKLPASVLAAIVGGGSHPIEVAGKTVALDISKVDIRRSEKKGLSVLNEGSLTVALDTEITEELLMEGWVRDLVRGVQTLRKDSGFEVTDRIRLVVAGDDDLKRAFETYGDFVRDETLALGSHWASGPAIPGSSGSMSEIEAGEKVWRVSIARAH
ncbi:MAG TPA: isoleucine--tRNA ligase [Rectinemataceae bacterium]|nr:isoleucine--tRNA ligase [Rectinemataceae bacterium]